MPGDGVSDNVAPQGCQPSEGTDFIRTDQARIAHDIAEMDTNAQPQRLTLTGLCLDLLLDFHRTGYGLNRASELN